MNSIYMRLYDFFHKIANYFWHKHIDSIKQKAKAGHGITKQKKEKQQEKSNTNKQSPVLKGKSRNKKKV